MNQGEEILYQTKTKIYNSMSDVSKLLWHTILTLLTAALSQTDSTSCLLFSWANLS